MGHLGTQREPSEIQAMSTRQYFLRIGAVAAISGALTLFTATLLHPMDADPNDAATAFAEYADDTSWVASHLAQFLGMVLLGVALVALAATMETAQSSVWARIGALGIAASVATTAALQAVDGVALKVMVDRWAQTSGEARAHAFEAAFAVRQIEVGLASLLSILIGLTMVAFAIALRFSKQFPKWVATLGLLGGVVTVAAGIAQAYTGFSTLAMRLSMGGGSVLLLWAMIVGVFMWRLAPRLPVGNGVP
jgi:uncharacterized protein (DUF983 family)